jgi:hypothetical protein
MTVDMEALVLFGGQAHHFGFVHGDRNSGGRLSSFCGKCRAALSFSMTVAWVISQDHG